MNSYHKHVQGCLMLIGGVHNITNANRKHLSLFLLQELTSYFIHFCAKDQNTLIEQSDTQQSVTCN